MKTAVLVVLSLCLASCASSRGGGGKAEPDTIALVAFEMNTVFVTAGKRELAASALAVEDPASDQWRIGLPGVKQKVVNVTVLDGLVRFPFFPPLLSWLRVKENAACTGQRRALNVCIDYDCITNSLGQRICGASLKYDLQAYKFCQSGGSGLCVEIYSKIGTVQQYRSGGCQPGREVGPPRDELRWVCLQ